MTRTPYRRDRNTDGTIAPKPYELIPFPEKPLTLKHPVGHHKYLNDHLHGTLKLTLTVKTPLHVSTGVAVMGSDVGNDRIPLIKTMIQGTDRKLSIQGSSLKGCIRSVYEAITNSTLAVTTNKFKDKIPKERLPCRKKEQLCPASRVFGALNWQGSIEFSDAQCQQVGFTTGFMPSLYRPRPDEREAYFKQGKVAGRKFYYHTIKAIDKGQNQGIPVQQAGKEYIFTTRLQFKNLKPEELGTLLIVLGQDDNYPIALKVGGGKPIGMGTMIVTVDAIDCIQGKQALYDRYSSYTPPQSHRLTVEEQQAFIQDAHANLIEKTQLEELSKVLHYPTNRQPPTGMY